MPFEAGDCVERRFGTAGSRFGRILGRCHEDYEVYYVNVGVGMTHVDPARDLRADPRGSDQQGETDLPIFSEHRHSETPVVRPRR